MKSQIIIIIVLCLISKTAISQQADEIRFNFDNQYINNPAALSIWGQSEGNLYYQDNFTAFPNSPVIYMAGFQYAIPDQTASVGINVTGQQAGVINNTSVHLSSSYKMLGLVSNGDYLAGGIGIDMSRISIKEDKIRVNNEYDPIVLNGFDKALGANVSIGLLYSSLRILDSRRMTPSWQLGLSMVRALPQNINLSQLNYKNRYSFNGLAAILFPLGEDMSLRSIIQIQYEGSKLLNTIASAEINFAKVITTGVSFDVYNTLGFTAGFLLNDLFSSETELHVSLFGNLPFGELDRYVNSGYGIGIQYRINDSKFSKY